MEPMAEYTSYASSPSNSSPCNGEPGNNGNIGYIVDNVNIGWTQSFTYDGLNRLMSGARSDGGYNHTYIYDSFGNLLIQDNINPGPTYSINPSSNQLNRLANNVNIYDYDAAGNLISSGTSDIAGHTFTYNALSQITAVDGGSTASYWYNGSDERVLKTTASGWTDYVYLGGRPMAEQTQDGTYTDYIYAEGQKIAKIATPSGGSATVNYYLDDHLGTTQVELDASGNVTWKGQFTPFGVELDSGGTTMHYKFTGKERDNESGLDYFGARYFSSNMGRWMSPDWSAKEEPVPYSKLDNPQTLNLYSYVVNNPLSQLDDDGHEIIYAANLKNAQLVKDTVQAALANPNTSGSLSGYVGPNNPNLIIQSGDLSYLDNATQTPMGTPGASITNGLTTPDIQTTSGSSTDSNGVVTQDPVVTTLTGATITIDNRLSAGDTPGVILHEDVHAGEARANPAQYNKDAAAEKNLPHDKRPQEQRANAASAANVKDIKKAVKQIEKDRKKDQQ